MPKPSVGARGVNFLQRIKEGQRKIEGVREWGRAGEEPRIGSVRPPTAGAWGVIPPPSVSLFVLILLLVSTKTKKGGFLLYFSFYSLIKRERNGEKGGAKERFGASSPKPLLFVFLFLMCEGEAFLVFKREGGQTRRRERAPTGAGGVHLSPFPFFLLPPKQGKRHKERGCERKRGGSETARAPETEKGGVISQTPSAFLV